MYEVTKRLEVELVPYTSELGLRVGLNSGPVVAGVLREDKSRFHLFCDTVSWFRVAAPNNNAIKRFRVCHPRHIPCSQSFPFHYFR
jgi:hypothetical protein